MSKLIISGEYEGVDAQALLMSDPSLEAADVVRIVDFMIGVLEKYPSLDSTNAVVSA